MCLAIHTYSCLNTEGLLCGWEVPAKFVLLNGFRGDWVRVGALASVDETSAARSTDVCERVLKPERRRQMMRGF